MVKHVKYSREHNALVTENIIRYSIFSKHVRMICGASVAELPVGTDSVQAYS